MAGRSGDPDTPRVPSLEVVAWASLLARLLAPACERVEVAGSLRRGAATVGDVELVLVPRPVEILEPDLPATIQRLVNDPSGWLAWDTQVKRNGPRLKRLVSGTAWPGLPVELYIASAENFGNILAIRTGDQDFSHLLVTARAKGGLMPGGMRQADGFLWRGPERVDCPTEEAFFAALGLPWVQPEWRDEATALHMARCARAAETLMLK